MIQPIQQSRLLGLRTLGVLLLALGAMGFSGDLRSENRSEEVPNAVDDRNIQLEIVRATHFDDSFESDAIADDQTLWLARCIFSETKRPEEQELVAWVVRNRVETHYRGVRSYKEAVLDPYQFSAFIPGTAKRFYYASLDVEDQVNGWQQALAIARMVRNSAPWHRPFPQTTRHFYSERSMIGATQPHWSSGQDMIVPERPFSVDARRFRFYADIR